MTAVPQFVLFRHLSTVGSPRRDVATGTLIAPGEDLGAPGVTEWCFDVIYVTWACQVGSALIGESFWWLYLSVSTLQHPICAVIAVVHLSFTPRSHFFPQIPLYAAWKLWSSIVGPMLGFNNRSPTAPVAAEANPESTDADSVSRKQQKAQKKAEKRNGAPDVKVKRR